MKIPISVITVAYNAEQFIAETIKSILNQTERNFEYIIIDDKSTDSTWKIISKFANKDSRIKAVKNKKNLGIAGNRNEGLRHAKGEFIVWQDADDIAYKNRLKKLYIFMKNNPQVGICGSYLEFFDNSGTISFRKYFENDELLRQKIFRYSPVAQPAAILRRSVVNKAGIYDIKMPPAEDLDMSFRIGSISKFANVAEPLIKYRVHNESATFKKLKRMELNTLSIRFKYRNAKGYNVNLFDYLFNIIQLISIYLIPPKWKILIFNFFRNTK